MAKRREDYSKIELELDEAQEVLVRVFMFEGALSERERIEADIKEIAKKRHAAAESDNYPKTLTFDEILAIVNGVELK